MKSKGLIIVCLISMFLLSACTENEAEGITLVTNSTTELYSVINQSTDIKFKTNNSWTANCNANWLTFSPRNGKAGTNVITVSTTSTNRTKNSRHAQISIMSGGKITNVDVRQRDEYALFEDKELNLPSTESIISPRFTTNVAKESLGVYVTNGLNDWVKAEKSDKAKSRTRADSTYEFRSLRIMENTSKDARDGALILTMEDRAGNILGLDTLFLYQEGADDGYRSVDYSQDGKVELLNSHTQGKGIPIVLMGDGFIDKDIVDSSYAKTMKQSMENLFSEEPVKSLRDYFDVYQVTAVSARNRFDGINSTVFGAVPDRQTMGIDVDKDIVMKYVKKVENIDSINTLAVVILNTNINRGVTYMIGSMKSDYNYSIALCPVIDSLKSEMFRQVLVHEAIGHGFAKLADEYVRSTEGSATEEDIKTLKDRHEILGWFLNVDSEKDSTKVLWSKFIYDAEFANEKIGTYEGGYTFYKGVYRPTEESMMRSNNAPFNAPSRQIIYKKVMRIGLGITPSYEEFVEFDRLHKPTEWHYGSRTRQDGEIPWRPAPPRIIWKDW